MLFFRSEMLHLWLILFNSMANFKVTKRNLTDIHNGLQRSATETNRPIDININLTVDFIWNIIIKKALCQWTAVALKPKIIPLKISMPSSSNTYQHIGSVCEALLTIKGGSMHTPMSSIPINH